MRKRGFTLIELLVVMTIIGLLMGIGLTAYMRVKDRARETRVRAQLQRLELALENFALNNGGYYPGVAADLEGTDDCDGDGVPEKSYSCYTNPDHPGIFPSAGVVGSHMPYMIRIDPPAGQPGGPRRSGVPQPDKSMWDRLYLDNDLDNYEPNPFYSQGPFPRPMVNVFEAVIPVQANNAQPVPTDASQRPVFVLPCLSLPDVQTGGNWYTDAGFNASARNPIASRRPLSGPCPSATGSITNGWEPSAGGQAPVNYPSGDFAYIPLDPVEWPDRDFNGAIDQPMFMVYVRSYILIGYGAGSAWSNKTYDVDFIASNEGGLRFDAPLGRVNLNDLTSLNSPPTLYEEMVRRAARGAIYLKATRYGDQFERTRR
ncbi:MAG: type II secretion system protein [bacterium JZ-2024 1]